MLGSSHLQGSARTKSLGHMCFGVASSRGEQPDSSVMHRVSWCLCARHCCRCMTFGEAHAAVDGIFSQSAARCCGVCCSGHAVAEFRQVHGSLDNQGCGDTHAAGV